MEGTDGTLCSFSERGYQCKNTATMDLHDKRWCRIHYERRMRKTLAQKQNRKRKRESSKVVFGENAGLVRSLGQQVNATTVGVTAQRSVEHSSSVSTEASVKHSTIDKNTISEKTSFNQDGSVKSVKRDVVNETEIATKEKYRVVMSQGFKITEIEKFSATNAKLTSSTPLVTFATHSPLLDDDDIFVLDEHQMERVEYHLKGLTETLGFATFAEMEAASCEEVVRRAWSNWKPFSYEMMDARVIAYIPFFVFYAHSCGNALVGPGAYPMMIRLAKMRYAANGATAWSRQISRSADKVSDDIAASYCLKNYVDKLFDNANPSWPRKFMNDTERERVARTLEPFVNGVGYDGSELAIEPEAKRKIANNIAWYIDRRIEHACSETKPKRPLPKMPHFIAVSMTRCNQYIETRLDDIEFDYSFRVNGLHDVISNRRESPVFETKLSARSAACFDLFRTKEAVENHMSVFQEKGNNVRSRRAIMAFNTFLDQVTGLKL